MKEEEEKKRGAEDCIHCGLCVSVCPVYKVLKDEVYGPRGRALMKEEGMENESFYFCTLCKACEEVCPVNISLELKEVRKKLKKTKKSKKMLENIKKYRNPMGEPEEGESFDELHCC